MACYVADDNEHGEIIFALAGEGDIGFIPYLAHEPVDCAGLMIVEYDEPVEGHPVQINQWDTPPATPVGGLMFKSSESLRAVINLLEEIHEKLVGREQGEYAEEPGTWVI